MMVRPGRANSSRNLGLLYLAFFHDPYQSKEAIDSLAFFVYSSSMTLISVEILESFAYLIYSSS